MQRVECLNIFCFSSISVHLCQAQFTLPYCRGVEGSTPPHSTTDVFMHSHSHTLIILGFYQFYSFHSSTICIHTVGLKHLLAKIWKKQKATFMMLCLCY